MPLSPQKVLRKGDLVTERDLDRGLKGRSRPRLRTLVGKVWSALECWFSALLRPDIFRAVVLLSVPYIRRSLDGHSPD